MNYLLIYWLIANSTFYSSTGTAVFADQASCQSALTAISKNWPSNYQESTGVCVPQGSATAAPAAPVTPTTTSQGPSQAAAPPTPASHAAAPSKPNG